MRVCLESTSMSRAISRRMRRPVERLRASTRKKRGPAFHRPSFRNLLHLARAKPFGYRVNRPAATSAIVARSGSGRACALGAHATVTSPGEAGPWWSHGDFRVCSPRPDLASRRPGRLFPVRRQRVALRSGVGAHAPSVVRRHGPCGEHGSRVVHGRTRDGQFLDRAIYRSPAACSRGLRGSRGWDWSERPPPPGGPPGPDASLRLVAPIAVLLVLALQPRALSPRLLSS